MPFKCIFITGGVVSSLGKGLTAASLAMLLEKKGLKVAMLKLDPYLNMDPGTMNPLEHGEIYVTDDGAETDLDLGHYHRFTSSHLSKASTATSGYIYSRVLEKERQGFFLGSTVQVIPHITNEIQEIIFECAKETNPDIILVEIGGTVGDIESLPFLEAVRQMRCDYPLNCLNIHMTYVPYIKGSEEFKSKPTQHSVQTLRSIGILPDIIFCRSDTPLNKALKQKISLFCSTPEEAVINIPNVQHSIYELPLILHDEQVLNFIDKKFNFPSQRIDLEEWKNLVSKLSQPLPKLKIALVGKYGFQQDAYKSIYESLSHAALNLDHSVEISMIDAENFNKEICNEHQYDAILIPGGFGQRGWEGKIQAAQYCRESKTPFFGICLGIQVLVVEFARNVCSLQDANSTEMNPHTPHPVICLMDNQDLDHKGGTMRLGGYKCILDPESISFKLYGKKEIIERHRHRYEVNPNYIDLFEKAGLYIAGSSEHNELCEILELQDHPWMIGVQFHPEFLSKFGKPHPLFTGFIKAAIIHSQNKMKKYAYAE